MALIEEQRNPWRAIVAGGDYNLSSQDWEDLLTELDSLYTEAPIAQPASAPSEQKAVACCVCDGKGTITDTENCEWPCYQCAKSKVTDAAGEQNTVVLPFAIFDQEMADLRRFHECVMDDEGYDVPKDRMKRLAEIGLVRSASGNYYEHTDFGLAVLNGYFDAAPQPDYKAQRDVERLDFLEKLVIESRTGVSVDFVRFVEDGLVTEKGFRLATFHNLRSRQPSLREAIDAAIASVKGGE